MLPRPPCPVLLLSGGGVAVVNGTGHNCFAFGVLRRRSVADPLPFSAPLALPSRRTLKRLIGVLGGTLAFPLLLSASPARLADAQAAKAGTSPELRVLLLESAGFRIAGDGGARLVDGTGKELLRLPPGGMVAIRSSAGRVVVDSASEGQAPLLAQPLAVGELWLVPIAHRSAAATFQLQQRRYHGRLLVRPANDLLRAINVIGVETYLPSVVGSEMPASWPLEALRAQAVAARTYALRQRNPEAPFDLKATVSSQVYKGLEAETASTRQATTTTRGLVLMYGNSLINAVFHSSSGGVTENSGDLWTRQLPYLVSVRDFDETGPVSQWKKDLAPELLAEAFAEIGGVNRIDVIASTASGRVRQARVIGPSGALVLSGAQLRSRLGLRSTMVRFEAAPFRFESRGEPGLSLAGDAQPGGPVRFSTPLGGLLGPPPPPGFQLPQQPIGLVAIGRGFGHGVGMSQWGAFALAQRGERFDQILRHYYRGAELRPFQEAVPGPLAAESGAEPGSAPWMSGTFTARDRP
ncbi:MULTISPECIES: SpoIID/LytB domain-containing protein [unclassified Synechococcus]|uniref:SpoIID/LytB domain-containing protein n=1 Tax=unclassified Synechococcus TaxID=2626047 RepID=UPI0021A3D0D4|nr:MULTISPECIES: SpoIID/LytB domain-containing protein [unclassified Synechococcus]MCT0212276.1 SpoIID/LytB domain-containing protein [Synechococcus sp. CS-1326]MCT0234311.1 SpoIID/LytB domain-containing protein [Synechococcus sp. CS-1327]